MKKIVTATAFAAASLASAGAMAQAYVSADIGQSHINLDCSGTTSCKNTATAGKLTAGYTYGYGLSGEIGYIDLGKVHAADAAGNTADAKAQAFTIGLAYAVPLPGPVGVNLRLGVASVKADASANLPGVGSGSISDTKAQAYGGIGASYAIDKNWAVEAGADFTRVELASNVKANARALTIGARYSF